MNLSLIETANLAVDLVSRPIQPSWIREGNPQAKSSILSCSADGFASTIVWHCTEGKFDWFYDFDETILILEGSIVIESRGMPARRYTAGDVLFFRNGAHATWHVEGYVKKLAFCRKTSPALFSLALRVFFKLKKLLLPFGTGQLAMLMVMG